MSATAEAAGLPFVLVDDGEDRERWLAARARGVGASEAALMVGQHPKHGEGGPAILWAEKTGRSEREDLGEIEAVRWGHVMEPVIVAEYASARYAGRRVEKMRALLQSTAHPWALCTLDAWTWHPEHGQIPLEVKNVGSYQAARWVDGTPLEMWWQLQHQMLVTGTPCASIAACVGGNSLWWEDVPRSDDAQRILALKGAAFWRCVQEDRVPLHVPTLATVAVLYPPGTESGQTQLVGAEWRDLDDRRQMLRHVAKTAEGELQAIDAKIRDAIGSHAAAMLDDGTLYTLTTQRRKETVVKASESRVLRRKEARR